MPLLKSGKQIVLSWIQGRKSRNKALIQQNKQLSEQIKHLSDRLELLRTANEDSLRALKELLDKKPQ